MGVPARTPVHDALGAPDSAEWTVADVDAIPEDGNRYELLEGALIVTPPSGFAHNGVAVALQAALNLIVPAGWRAGAAGVWTSAARDGYLVPDAMVVTLANPGNTSRFDPADVALVVEVVSPGSRLIDRMTKVAVYATAGIPLYLRVEPTTNTIHVYRLAGQEYAVSEDFPVGELVPMPEPFTGPLDTTPLPVS